MSSIIMSTLQSYFNSCFKACELVHPDMPVDIKLMYDMLNMIYYDETIRKIGFQYPTSLILCKYHNGELQMIGQHEDVLIKRKDTKNITNIDTKSLGIPFGLERDIRPYTKVASLALNEGDELLFYTDGITESENKKKEQFGVGRLSLMFYKSKTINTIVDEVRDWSSDEQLDDVTLLHIKVL